MPARCCWGKAPIRSPQPLPTSSTRASGGISRVSAWRRSAFMKSRAAGWRGAARARKKYARHSAARSSEREGARARDESSGAAVAAVDTIAFLFLFFERIRLAELLARPDDHGLVPGQVHVGPAEHQLVLATGDALRVRGVTAGVPAVDPDLGPGPRADGAGAVAACFLYISDA